MMIKRKLGVLAGSIALAASAQAAFTPGAPADQNGPGAAGTLYLALINQSGGTHIFDAGVTPESLAAGGGFTVDISAAAGLNADSYALFGVIQGAANGYDYSGAGLGYQNTGGFIYAGNGPAANEADGSALYSGVGILTAYAGAAAEGFNADGTAGDFGSGGTNTLFGNLSVSIGSVTSIFTQTGVGSFVAPVTNQIGDLTGSVVGNQFIVSGPVGEVPVPAAAWLFGSALLGLGVVRRK